MFNLQSVLANPGLTRLHAVVTNWLTRYSVPVLRISMGLVFLIFGVLKFFPGLSPAEALTEQTMDRLTLGLIPDGVGIVLVAALESAIGVCLVTGRFVRLGLALLGVAMVGILSPLVLFPGQLFAGSNAAPTLVGQYVMKDIVLVASTLVIAARVLGGQPVSGREEGRSPHDHDTPPR